MEVWLVDNNENPSISSSVHEISSSYPFIAVLKEPISGLSQARNTAITNAKGAWLIFLDDDVRVPTDFLVKARNIIASGDFDCFGGMYYPWYPIGQKPKWIPDWFGEKTKVRPERGEIIPGHKSWISANIMAVRRDALLAVGGFRTDLGMGRTIGYGEENDLQMRLHAAGYVLGFDPDWWVDHAVLPHKYKIGWHLRSGFAKGKTDVILHQRPLGDLVGPLLRSGLGALLKLPLLLGKASATRSYYWQNAIWDSCYPLWFRAGQVYECYLRKGALSRSSSELL